MPKIKIGFSTVLLALLLLFYTGFYSTFILLFCIVCHEMGHVFAARALKVKLRSIRCNLFGARIELELPLSSYMSEFVIALSGPAVNIIMGCVGIILEGRNADFFALVNFALALINLLPIATLDGGRILHTTVSIIFDARAADRSLRFISGVLIFLLWVVSVFLWFSFEKNMSLFIFSVYLFYWIIIKREY